MELSSNRVRSTGSTTSTALLTRQLAPSTLNPQATDSFISQLAGQLRQSPSPNLPHATDSKESSQPAQGIADLLQARDESLKTEPEKNGQAQGSPELRQAFQDFVGQTFFAEMIKACRSGQQPSAYFNGGRAEEIFQGQLDQVLSEELSKSSADKIADPMFELFMLKRQS